MAIQKLRVTLLLVLGLTVCSVQGFESVCRKLQVSTDISVIKDDVVKDGVPIDKWNRNSRNFALI